MIIMSDDCGGMKMCDRLPLGLTSGGSSSVHAARYDERFPNRHATPAAVDAIYIYIACSGVDHTVTIWQRYFVIITL